MERTSLAIGIAEVELAMDAPVNRRGSGLLWPWSRRALQILEGQRVARFCDVNRFADARDSVWLPEPENSTVIDAHADSVECQRLVRMQDPGLQSFVPLKILM